jgi:phytoene desaturase
MGKKHGVVYRTNANAEKIIIRGDTAVGVQAGGKVIAADIVVSNADMHFTESALLDAKHRDHSARYWKSRTLAPSALLLYLGINRRYPSLKHHNLLFSDDWRGNFAEIFGGKTFPTNPSLYVCTPSKTDPTVAPKGAENLFVLVPISAGITYSEAELQAFIDQVLLSLEKELRLPDLRRHIVYQKHFCVADFAEQYNSFQGTGLGLSHTLRQTAIFRPSNKSKKVRGLYYAGAGVHPGIGLPTALISAELVYKRLTDDRSAQPLKSL